MSNKLVKVILAND
jgi:predicted membrane-bound mannosyltransferase